MKYVIKALRGAIQCALDTEEEIAQQTKTLISTLIEKNNVLQENIISIHFTQTKDLYALNCASGLRQFGYQNVPLFCSQEPECSEAMPRMIRVLMTCYIETDRKCVHAYLNGAEKLRPDLSGT